MTQRTFIKTAVPLLSIVGISVALLLFEPNLAHAAIKFDSSGTLAGSSGLPTDTPTAVALRIISTFLQVLGIIALLMIIYGGYLIMSGGGIFAGGDQAGSAAQIKKGREVITWAIVGAIIILSSLGILEYIDTLLV